MGQFYINNKNIYDGSGQQFIMRGVSHEHSWFKADINRAIPAIANTGANVVRIVLSNGEVYEKDNPDSVRNIIDLCYNYKLIVILEVHDGTGSNDINILQKIANYWIELFPYIKGLEDRVIINIANEWYSQNNSLEWSNGYINIIPQLRNVGISNLFIVDCAGWGQYPNTISEKGLDIFNADKLKNTIFSIHMYENAGRDSETIINNINNALSINLPIIIGEFGHSHNNQTIDADTILNYCQEINIGWLAWSWYGNNEEAKYLDLCNGPDGNLTEWGEFIVNSNNGIKNTSVISGIFNFYKTK